MKQFDQHSFFRMSPQQKTYFVGFVTDTKNNYLAFEEGEATEYDALCKDVIENGRKNVDFSPYSQKATYKETAPQAKTDPSADFLKFLPGAKDNEEDPKVLKILEKISQPNARITLQECRVLFLEIFKNSEKKV